MDYTILKLLEHVPILTESNWKIWKWKFELIFKQFDLWPLAISDNANGNESKKQNEDKVRTLIGLWVDDSLLPLILDCSTANQMWLALVKHFEPMKDQKIEHNDESITVPITSKLFEDQVDKKSESCRTEQNNEQTQNKPNQLQPDSSSTRSHKVCNYCKKEGHLANKCWKRKKHNRTNEQTNNVVNSTGV